MNLTFLLLTLALSNSSTWANQATQQIVGGREVVSLDEAPSIVWLGANCAGSILSPRWIITAAHCTEMVSPMTVRIGSLAKGQGIERVAKAHYVHPLKKDIGLAVEYDVGLLEMDPPLDLEAYGRKPIRIASPDFEAHYPSFVGTLATVFGWGRLVFQGQKAQTLHRVDVPIVSNEIANASALRYAKLNDSMLAAGYANGKKDACNGDSGGPLVVRDPETQEQVLVGLVSWGDGCGTPNRYGVYARVSAAYDWVVEMMER